eukprot:scaffold482_cov266-Amphora_coffeaeformis.AAC.43
MTTMKRVLPSFVVVVPIVLPFYLSSCLLQLPPLLQSARQQGLLVDVLLPPPPQQPDGENTGDDRHRPRANPTQVFVLGTVHLGSTSAEEATQLIQMVQPHTVVLEMAPSRMDTLRRKRGNNNQNISSVNDDGTNALSSTKNNNNNPIALLSILWTLAAKGWSSGGISGMLVATTLVWTSLVKRTFTANEEADSLPRVDEFAAALSAADAVGAQVVAADVELDALLGAAAQSLSLDDWSRLATTVVAETVGWIPRDPVQRRRDESLQQWYDRRRDIETARASKRHGAKQCPPLARVLVGDRDEKMARACLRHATMPQTRPLDDNNDNDNNMMVCVVGLVHLDGVVERILQPQNNKVVEED